MMRGGDISSEMSARYVFVWEYLLAHLDPGLEKKHTKYLMKCKWEKAYDLWEEDGLCRDVLLDVLWRRTTPVDIVSFLPLEFILALGEQLEISGYPQSKIYSGRSLDLAHNPQIKAVFFYAGEPGNVSRVLSRFGSKGIPVRDGNDIQRAMAL